MGENGSLRRGGGVPGHGGEVGVDQGETAEGFAYEHAAPSCPSAFETNVRGYRVNQPESLPDLAILSAQALERTEVRTGCSKLTLGPIESGPQFSTHSLSWYLDLSISAQAERRGENGRLTGG